MSAISSTAWPSALSSRILARGGLRLYGPRAGLDHQELPALVCEFVDARPSSHAMALLSSTKTISHGGALQSSCFKGDILARRRSSAYALSEERPVCTNGQERRYSASPVSDFAHARASRVHKRTRPVTIRRASVRLRIRTSWSRADAGIEASGPTSAHPKKARVAGSRTRQKARPAFPGRRRVRMCTPRLQPRANAPALAAAPHASAARRGLPEMGARHACLVACSTNRRALRTPSRTPSPREAHACRPVVCGTIHK